MLRTPAPLIGALGVAMIAGSVLAAKINRAFSPDPYTGVVAPHKCLECDELQLALQNKAWNDIKNTLMLEIEGCLPLLAPDAFQAFFPAWLSLGLDDPEGTTASFAIIHLKATDRSRLFTVAQRRVILEWLEYIWDNTHTGLKDVELTEDFEEVRSKLAP